MGEGAVDRVRGVLLDETGIDFARYRRPDLIEALSGWRRLATVVTTAVKTVLIGGIGLILWIWLLLRQGGGAVGVGASVVIGLALVLVVLVTVVLRRLARQAVEDAELVCDAALEILNSVGEEAGDLTVGQLTRGIVVVGAVPSISAGLAGRIPVIGGLTAGVFERLVGGVLDRALVATGAETEVPGNVRTVVERSAELLSTGRAGVLRLFGTIERAVVRPLVVGLAIVACGQATILVTILLLAGR